MSLPRPSGLKAPSKIGRPSGIAQPKSGIPAPGAIAAKAQRVACPPQEGALAKSARAAGIATPLAEKYATQVLPSLPLPGPEPEIVAPPIDDFKIGDRIFVGGTKLGTIAFIGETQFAAGEWAGVVLDDPIGKNDGSVAGVRYFQCEPKRGVFARLTKLTRTPGALMGTSRRSDDTHSDSPSNSALGGSGAAPNGNPQATSTPLHRPTTPRRGLGQAPSDSNSSLNRSPIMAGQPPSMTQSLNASVAGGLARPGLKVGDRVLVSGSKPGILRYLGTTDFAKGNWAGVELDEPLGKNDGAVAGKRYFECKPMYGLFAPVHKVTKVGSAGATPSPQSRSLTASGLRSARERSGSQESVSSISSTASSVSRSRKALKEKEEHIEQLLRERDLERAEVARAAEQVDETEKRLMSMHVDHERLKGDAEDQLTKLKTLIRELEKEKQELILKLEDERRKVEDLQFQIEEETISKDDLECRSEADEAKLKQLERNYEKEKARAEKMEAELTALKRTVEQQQQHLKSGEETQTAYLDQIEELTYKLTQAENKIHTYESSKLEDGAKTSQVSMELAEKAERVHSLEDQLSARNKEIKTLKDKMLQMEDELKTTNGKNKKLEDTIVELNNKVKSGETNHTKLNDEIRDLRSQQSDLQQRLDTSLARSEELSDDKAKLEQQLADLMKNSGDSSKQLSMMNEQLMEKSRKVEEVQNDLSSSTQKILKLNDTVEKLKQDSEREKEELVNSHREELAKLQAQLEDSQTKVEKLERHTAKLQEDSEQEKQELVARKDGEIAELKKTLAERSEELSKQEVQTQAHKQVLDSITLEKEAMKFEKEKAEKAQKRLEAEKAETSTQLAKSQVEVSKLEASLKKANASLESVQEQLQDLQDSQERAVKARQEAEEQRDKLKAEKEKAVEERDTLHQDLMTARAELQKHQIQVEEAQKEVDRLKTELAAQREELMTKSQSEQEASDLSVELKESRGAVRELQGKLAAMEAERDKLKADLEYSKLVLEERKRLEDQNANLQKQVEETNKRLSEEVAARESEKEMLTSQLSNSASKLQKQEQELQAHRNKISNLQNENMTLAGLKQDIQQLELQSEKEKKDLLDKIRLLEKTLSDSRANANVDSGASGDPALSQMQQEKDAADKQIEFLNSVIVDMQKKNADLKVRLEAMEAGVLNGSASSAPDVSPSRRAAPRLFCDICDMFDLHDTDDCPKQAMSEDSPPPTSYHGDRKQLRPYCDTCEDFDPEQRHIEGASDVDDADYTEHALSQPLPSEAEALKLLEAEVEKTPSRTSIDDITLLQGQGTVGWKRQRPKFHKIESESEPELVEAFDNSDDDDDVDGEDDADDETEKEEKGDAEAEKDAEMEKEEEAARKEGRRDVIEEEAEEQEEEEGEDQTATDGDVNPKQQPFTASLNPLYTSDEEHPDMSDSTAFNIQPLATLPYMTGGSPKKPTPQETPSKKQEKKAEPTATDGDALAPLPNVKAADPLAHVTSMTASYPPAGKASGVAMTSAEESDVTKESDVAVAQATGTLEGAPKPGWRKNKAKARPVSYAGTEEEKGGGQAAGQQKEDSCVVS